MSTVARIVVVYVFIVVALRVMGKREFSQLSPLELVTLLLVPELVSQAVLGEDFSITNALIALSALFSMVFLSSVVQFHFGPAAKVVNGTPTVLAHSGRLFVRNMALERVSEEEILSEMHMSGLERLDQVEWAILETDGRIAIVPKEGGIIRKPREETAT